MLLLLDCCNCVVIFTLGLQVGYLFLVGKFGLARLLLQDENRFLVVLLQLGHFVRMISLDVFLLDVTLIPCTGELSLMVFFLTIHSVLNAAQFTFIR